MRLIFGYFEESGGDLSIPLGDYFGDDLLEKRSFFTDQYRHRWPRRRRRRPFPPFAKTALAVRCWCCIERIQTCIQTTVSNAAIDSCSQQSNFGMIFIDVSRIQNSVDAGDFYNQIIWGISFPSSDIPLKRSKFLSRVYSDWLRLMLKIWMSRNR